VLLHRWGYGVDEGNYRADTIARYSSSNEVTGEKEERKMAKLVCQVCKVEEAVPVVH
jgi:hypothetical protein